MKKIYKIILSITILIGIGIVSMQVFGDSLDDKLECALKKDLYSKYECEVKNICKKNEYGKNDKKIATLKHKKYTKDMKYKDALKNFMENQNQIYKCGKLETDRRANTTSKLQIKADKTGDAKSAIMPKIKQKLDKIKQQKSKDKCKDVKNGSATKSTLDQSTLEYCKFKFFTNYLIDNEVKVLEKTLKGKDRVGYTTMKKNIGKLKEQINETEGYLKRTMGETFKNYSQYDNYKKIHEQLIFHASLLRMMNKKTKKTLRQTIQNMGATENNVLHQSAE